MYIVALIRHGIFCKTCASKVLSPAAWDSAIEGEMKIRRAKDLSFWKWMRIQILIIINYTSITEKTPKEEPFLDPFLVALRDGYVSPAFVAGPQFTYLFFLCALNCT